MNKARLGPRPGNKPRTIPVAPCDTQCNQDMRDFCARTGAACVAYQLFVETGIAAERSARGWVVPA
jgi:hypothetical protein